MTNYRGYFSNPKVFPHTVESISFIETHISLLCLTGSYVYKLKKPVIFGGILDFSTLEKRQHYCHEEIRLNRRFAPELYDRVVCLHPDKICTDLDTKYEFAVRMKELRQEDILVNQLIKGKGISIEVLDDLITQLVRFYQRTDKPRNGIHFQILKEKIKENFETLNSLTKIDVNYQYQVNTYLENYYEVFSQRIQGGKIVDGHGDLHPKNMFVGEDKVIIFDCIEFNPMLRIIDQAEDIAFFAVELDRFGLNKESEYFTTKFAKTIDDQSLDQVLNFYKSYRASVRQKVLLFRRSELIDDSEDLQHMLFQEAEIYRKLAVKYMEG